MNKDNIKRLIAMGETKTAIELTIQLVQKDPVSKDFYHEIVLISAYYNDINNSYIKGVVSIEEHTINHNRLLIRLLNLIDQLSDLEEASIQNKEIPLYEAKLIFIGSGNVGKTSLVNTIIDGRYNPNEIKTEGICIRDWKVKQSTKGNISSKKGSFIKSVAKFIFTEPVEENAIDVHIWDFGGQEIMHATHKFFMTQNSVYVIVVTPREEDRYGETELSYWLKLVQSFAPDSPMIVAINKCEVHTHNIDKRTYLINYPNIISFIETSCVLNLGIGELINDIETAIKTLPHLGKPIPQSYFLIKKGFLKSKKISLVTQIM